MPKFLFCSLLLMVPLMVACPPPAQPPTTQSGVTVTTPKIAVGDSCWKGSECESGVCEGFGCGEAGTCVEANRMCTMIAKQYCSCEGIMFEGSGCPGQRVSTTGAECRGGVSFSPLDDGAACLSSDECASGICEGVGCGESEPGVCVPKERMCTMDLRAYCGCDGKTFESSGSCPGKRYAKRGKCEAVQAAGANGASCLTNSDCESGVCEGMGCGDDQPGVCVPKVRPCTKDLRQYCGCDGKTFRGSGSCPGKRYATRGACP